MFMCLAAPALCERPCVSLPSSYLADVPRAHSERVRKLLPALLGVQGGAGSGGSLAACCFLLPLLSQVRGVNLGDSSADSYTSACDS